MSKLQSRVLDIKITKTEKGFHIYIPIKAGALQIELDRTIEPLTEFLDTAINSEPRRFGENPC